MVCSLASVVIHCNKKNADGYVIFPSWYYYVVMKNTLIVSCFFLSGFAGLVYEVAWIRRASLVIGSTTWALSIVLAVFFGGMALGSWLIGNWSQKVRQPVRVYGLLEIGLAITAFLSLPAFGWIEGLYGAAYRSAVTVHTDAEGLTWLVTGQHLVWIQVGLVALVLLLPTFLMGGTLPLFCRQFISRDKNIVQNIGALYAVNTAGAVAGTLAAGFLFIPVYGVSGAVNFAVAINLVIGVVAMAARFQPLPEFNPSVAAEDIVHPSRSSNVWSVRRWLPVLLFFNTGLVVVGAEVFWSRFLSLVIRDSVTTYTITLAVVLAGIVMGSLAVSWLDRRQKLPVASLPTVFGALQIFSALAIVVAMFLPATRWLAFGDNLLPYFWLMLPAAVLSGASFPVANRMVLAEGEFAAASVGKMVAFNTGGGIVGSLAVGFWLLPSVGLEASVKIITGLGLLTGILVLLLMAPKGDRWQLKRMSFIALGIAVWLGYPVLTHSTLPAGFLGMGGELLDYEEGHSATLSTVKIEGKIQLEIDNLWQGIDTKGHQIMAAHLPSLLHANPSDVLVIGVGVGQTAGRFLDHNIASLDCVDIEPAIFPFIDRNFPNAWLRDKRVHLVADDGRSFLSHTVREYDIISVEVGQIFRPGIDVFYTQEFYADARKKLRTGGIIAQFVPLGFLPAEAFDSVVATFMAEFPAASLWYNTQELLLIGGVEEMPQLDLSQLRKLAKNTSGLGNVEDDLAWSHWGGAKHHLIHPGALLGSFLADSESLREMTGAAPVYVDDTPRLAYQTRAANVGDHHEEPMARRLADHLASLNRGAESPATPAEMKLAMETRQLNLRDIVASGLIAQVTGNQEPAQAQGNIRLLSQALQLNPESYLGNANLGKLHLIVGQVAQAEPYLLKAVELRPESATSLRDLGLVYVASNRPAEAMPYLQKAVELMPEDFGAHNYLGSALAMTGRPRQAVAHFEKALLLQPGDSAVQQNLARARREAAGR
ncbi:MAG: spermidine synthase [Candidatus Krumholzibacteriia bacterium]